MHTTRTRILVATVLSVGALALLVGVVAVWSPMGDAKQDETPAIPATAMSSPSPLPSGTINPGQPAVSGSMDQLLDMMTRRVTQLWATDEVGGGLTFSADGRFVVYSSGNRVSDGQTIRLIDLTSAERQPQDLTQGANSQILLDGRMVAFATRPPDPQIQVNDLTTRSIRSMEPPGQLPIWSPNGRWLTYWSLFTSSPTPTDRTLYLVDTRDWSARIAGTAYPCQCDAPYGPFWSPDSRWFYHPYPSDRQPALIDPTSLVRTTVAGYPYWSPEGKRFITLDQQSMTLHEGPSGPAASLVEGQPGIQGPLWSRDGTMVAYQGANDGITAVSTASARRLWQLPGFSTGWSSDGEFFAAAEKGGRLEIGRLNVVRSADGAPFHSLENVLNAAWSPSAPVLAFTRIDATACSRPDNPVKLSLHLFDVPNGQERPLLEGLESICRGSRPVIVWAPDGRHLALCSTCGGL